MDGTTIVTIAIMIAGFIGMIISAKIQKTNPNAKILAFICLLIVLGGAIKFLVDQGIFGGDSREIKQQKDSYYRFRQASAKKMGEYLAKKFAGKKILIVAPNGTDFNAPGQDLSIPNAFKDEYLKGATVTIKGLPYKPSDNMAVDPTMNAKYFNQLFKENSDIDLFLFTIQLPYDPSALKGLTIWNGKAKIALMDAAVNFLGAEIAKGKVAAAVVQRTDLTQKDFETLAPTDLDKAFAARYLLVTPENVKDIKAKYPVLFQR